MKAILSAFMIVLGAIVLHASPADAGGIRAKLNFGYPLGSFVARPTRTYVGRRWTKRRWSKKRGLSYRKKWRGRKGWTSRGLRWKRRFTKKKWRIPSRGSVKSVSKSDGGSPADKNTSQTQRRETQAVGGERREPSTGGKTDAVESVAVTSPREKRTPDPVVTSGQDASAPKAVGRQEVQAARAAAEAAAAAQKARQDQASPDVRAVAGSPAKSVAAQNAKPAKAKTCRRFIESAGVTVSVPCLVN